jgi:hypothetical protein
MCEQYIKMSVEPKQACAYYVQSEGEEEQQQGGQEK